MPGGLHYNGRTSTHRSRGSRQPPVRRQPVVFPDDGERRLARHQGRRSSTSSRIRPAATRRARTGYVFDTDYLLGADGPVFDAQGRIIPLSCPAQPSSRTGSPTRGANLDIAHAVVLPPGQLGDRSAHCTFDLGVRIEIVKSEATGGIIGVDTNTTVPRLAATYDISDKGRTCSRRPTRTTPASTTRRRSARNSPVANPAEVLYVVQRSGRAGRRLRPRLRPRELRRSSSGRSRRRTSSSKPACRRRSPTSSRSSVGQQIGQRGIGEGDLHQPRRTTTSSRTSSTIRRRAARPTSSRTASTSAPSTTSSIATAICRSGSTRRC